MCIMSRYRAEGPDVSELSEELKKKFALALKGKLEIPTCRDCPSARGFVQVVEFLIDGHLEAVERMDKVAQVMEEFIEVFRQLEERAMKERFGNEGR